MMTPDRRAEGLKIAASILRRRGVEERVVSAKELVDYAKVLDRYILHGEIHDDENVEVDLKVGGTD